ncbi:MAG: type II secretion system protein [bacterium]|nr:type II secretion system protein [bacterium]
MRQVKGFTLIELLIVIAILAILATVVLLVINPVQMFAQARDSQRIYDMNTLSNATALYLTTATSPDLDSSGGFVCGTNFGTSVTGASENFTGSGTIYSAFTSVTTGLGWVPVAYTSITGGSPISALPMDPTNTVASTYYYTYACDNTNKWFEFNANMESDRYRNGASGADDVESTDGGDTSTIYEVGNDPGLDL